ncbi:MAG: hypothetical protein IPL59_19860 [Candidatus Competibacteraceae bacterium]|nr:hypothetical protein [Candidatus Competibacteraceae bacterium]
MKPSLPGYRIPVTQRSFQRKTDLALNDDHPRPPAEHRLALVGFDGFYGSDPPSACLDAQGEVFVGEVHMINGFTSMTHTLASCPPRPAMVGLQPAFSTRPGCAGRPVGGTATGEACNLVTLRNGTEGALRVEILHRTVWL